MEILRVRNGKRVPPQCPKCGCRLQEFENGDLFHFQNAAGTRDMRGCKCVYLDHLWNRYGKVIYA